MTLSTHVLDTTTGRPAPGIPVLVERFDTDRWTPVASGVTDRDGRAGDLVSPEVWGPGRWRLIFSTGTYLGDGAFWPEVSVAFVISGEQEAAPHHHVPLLLSPYGYSTYRGS